MRRRLRRMMRSMRRGGRVVEDERCCNWHIFMLVSWRRQVVGDEELEK